jgi:hypothetical protein
MKRIAAYVLVSIVAAMAAGCQMRADRTADTTHSCVVTPANLVECDLDEGAGRPGRG